MGGIDKEGHINKLKNAIRQSANQAVTYFCTNSSPPFKKSNFGCYTILQRRSLAGKRPKFDESHEKILGRICLSYRRKLF